MNRAVVIFFLLIGCSVTLLANCPPQGDSKELRIRALDLLKNRTQNPTKIDPSITLDAILAPGDDSNRFSPDQSAIIEGYVAVIERGGPETCHCGASGAAQEDTHVGVVSDPKYAVRKPKKVTTTDSKGKKHSRFIDANAIHHMIAEFTPQSRKSNGIPDTATLAKMFPVGTHVRITGRIFNDEEHKQNAFNTNPRGTNLWRATIVEVHPAFKIEKISDHVTRDVAEMRRLKEHGLRLVALQKFFGQ